MGFLSILSARWILPVALGLLLIGWTVWKRYWPASAAGTVGTVVGGIADEVAQKAAVVQAFEIKLLCQSRGDTASAALATNLLASIAAWEPPARVPAVTPPIVTVNTVAGAPVQVQTAEAAK